MDRRKFLVAGSSVLAGSALTGLPARSGTRKPTEEPALVTVTGPRPSSNGIFLSHEHIVSRFGEPPESMPQYDYENAKKVIIPYLNYLTKLGVGTIACCTTKYFGRDAALLRELSQDSGMQIISNTGYYGAAKDRYIPESAYAETPDEIAQRWIDEWKYGIDDTGVRPGFIKIGIDGGGLSEIDAKLVRAAAITHLETGLTIAAHTGNNVEGAGRQITILKEEGVSPSAWVWVHADNVGDIDALLRAADVGAWISLDGLRTANYYEGRSEPNSRLQQHYALLKSLNADGLGHRVLLSHDGSSYPQAGKSKRSMDTLVTAFIPLMQAAGISGEEIENLTAVNPTRAFSIAKRKI